MLASFYVLFLCIYSLASTCKEEQLFPAHRLHKQYKVIQQNCSIGECSLVSAVSMVALGVLTQILADKFPLAQPYLPSSNKGI